MRSLTLLPVLAAELLVASCWTPASGHLVATAAAEDDAAEQRADAQGSGGLVAYYPFGGGPADQSGNANDALVRGATLAADRFGNPASAYDFEGDDYLEVPDAPNLNPPVITISAWFRLRSFAGTYPPIVKKSGQGTLQLYGYMLECHPNPQGQDGSYIGPAVGFNAFLDTGWGDADFWFPIQLDLWHFAAATYDGTEFVMYLDGVRLGSMVKTGSVTASPNSLYIGRDPSNPDREFDGLIDDVRIYSRALSEKEVEAVFLRESRP